MNYKQQKAMFAKLGNLNIRIQRQTETPANKITVRNRMYLEGGFNGLPYVKGGIERETTEQKQARIKAKIQTFRAD